MWWNRSVAHVALLSVAAIAAGSVIVTPWTKGVPYVDAGAIAVDAYDGPVAVTTSGVVRYNRVGYYDVRYSAVDASGNRATAVRRVHVTRGGR